MDSILINGQRIYGLNLEALDDNGQPIYKFFGITEEQASQLRNDMKWSEIRKERDALIAETDWTQTGDTPISTEKKAEFAAYRQLLRDIPQTYSNPDDVIWPEKPTV